MTETQYGDIIRLRRGSCASDRAAALEILREQHQDSLAKAVRVSEPIFAQEDLPEGRFDTVALKWWVKA